MLSMFSHRIVSVVIKSSLLASKMRLKQKKHLKIYSILYTRKEKYGVLKNIKKGYNDTPSDDIPSDDIPSDDTLSDDTSMSDWPKWEQDIGKIIVEMYEIRDPFR